MSDIVFVLGAGASKQDGAPLMYEFLDVAKQLHALGVFESDAARVANVFKAIGQLQAVHSKAELDIVNIESVFSAFEMAKTIGSFPGKDDQEIEVLLADLRLLIALTLERSIKFPVYQGNSIEPTDTYASFVDLICHLRDKARPVRSVSVITFNYDIALDFACHHGQLAVDYALGSQPHPRAVPILKLHGSLNWSTCPKCSGTVVPVTFQQYLGGHRGFMHEPRSVVMPFTKRFHQFKHDCGEPLESSPVLVPPTWHKQDYHRTISGVWRRAAKELSEAENVFVLGYSLPPSDSFFRYLFALGSVGEKPLERFWVYDIDDSEAFRTRFSDLLGKGASARFRHIPLPFSLAISDIKRVFPGQD